MTAKKQTKTKERTPQMRVQLVVREGLNLVEAIEANINNAIEKKRSAEELKAIIDDNIMTYLNNIQARGL